MVLNIDLAPTLLELAGLPVPPTMEGQSLVPILQNPQTIGRTAWLYEYFKDFPYRVPQLNAVRTDRYKYIDYEGVREDELFDLVRDPKEKQNLVQTAEGLPGQGLKGHYFDNPACSPIGLSRFQQPSQEL